MKKLSTIMASTILSGILLSNANAYDIFNSQNIDENLWTNNPTSIMEEFNKINEMFKKRMEILNQKIKNMELTTHIKENNKEYIYEIEIPGTKKEDVTITLKNNILIVKGKKKYYKKEVDKGKKEEIKKYSTFIKEIVLKPDANTEEIKDITLKDGILKIVIPKKNLKQKKKEKRKILKIK